MASSSTFSNNKCCILCKSREVDEVTFGTIYKCNKIEVHYFCLLLSSSLEQRGEDEDGILGFLPYDILEAAKQCSTRVCAYCNENGANITCSSRRCKVTFHYPCGIANGSRHKFSGEFPSFCFKHRSEQKIPEYVIESTKDIELDCIVCMEKVEPSNNSIWAPCCKNTSFFHKTCLQRMASSFGSYLLKCPLCNNEKQFTSALINNGIFIPEQDASWETPDAFSELLERYSHCDAVNCISRKGRDYSTRGKYSNWVIILCTSCGSQGIHKKCIEGTKKIDKRKKNMGWECDICAKSADGHGADTADSRSTPTFEYGIFQSFGNLLNLPETNNNYSLPVEKKTAKRRRTTIDSDEQNDHIRCNLTENELSYAKRCRVVLMKYQ